MTEKKEKILKSALELFANEGFHATSTSKVAKHAGVSEGLIFRHFENKEGLLDAILNDGEERSKVLFSDIIFTDEPKEVIRKTLDMILSVGSSKDKFEFWKLQYKIKWETERYNEFKMEPLQMALANAFKKLAYESPEMEAINLLITIDGLATRFSLQESFDPKPIVSFLKKKYKV
jgi:AcrR family transcriptional regulator